MYNDLQGVNHLRDVNRFYYVYNLEDYV